MIDYKSVMEFPIEQFKKYLTRYPVNAKINLELLEISWPHIENEAIEQGGFIRTFTDGSQDTVVPIKAETVKASIDHKCQFGCPCCICISGTSHCQWCACQQAQRMENK